MPWTLLVFPSRLISHETLLGCSIVDSDMALITISCPIAPDLRITVFCDSSHSVDNILSRDWLVTTPVGSIFHIAGALAKLGLVRILLARIDAVSRIDTIGRDQRNAGCSGSIAASGTKNVRSCCCGIPRNRGLLTCHCMQRRDDPQERIGLSRC